VNLFAFAPSRRELERLNIKESGAASCADPRACSRRIEARETALPVDTIAQFHDRRLEPGTGLDFRRPSVTGRKRTSAFGQKQTLVYLGGIALVEALAQGNSQIAYDDRGGEKTHQTKVSTEKVNNLVNQFPLGATKKPLFLGSDEGRSLPCCSVPIGSRGRA